LDEPGPFKDPNCKVSTRVSKYMDAFETCGHGDLLQYSNIVKWNFIFKILKFLYSLLCLRVKGLYKNLEILLIKNYVHRLSHIISTPKKL